MGGIVVEKNGNEKDGMVDFGRAVRGIVGGSTNPSKMAANLAEIINRFVSHENYIVKYKFWIGSETQSSIITHVKTNGSTVECSMNPNGTIKAEYLVLHCSLDMKRENSGKKHHMSVVFPNDTDKPRLSYLNDIAQDVHDVVQSTGKQDGAHYLTVFKFLSRCF